MAAFLSFWPFGSGFPCILAFWALISLHFGVLGLAVFHFGPPPSRPPPAWCSSAPGVQARVRTGFIGHVAPGVPVTPLTHEFPVTVSKQNLLEQNTVTARLHAPEHGPFVDEEAAEATCQDATEDAGFHPPGGAASTVWNEGLRKTKKKQVPVNRSREQHDFTHMGDMDACCINANITGPYLSTDPENNTISRTWVTWVQAVSKQTSQDPFASRAFFSDMLDFNGPICAGVGAASRQGPDGCRTLGLPVRLQLRFCAEPSYMAGTKCHRARMPPKR